MLELVLIKELNSYPLIFTLLKAVALV